MRIICLFFALHFTACQTIPAPQPIIDVHRHAPLASSQNKMNGPDEMLSNLRVSNVALAIVSVTSQEQLNLWNSVESSRLLLGVMMPCPRNLAKPLFDCFPATEGLPDLNWLRHEIENGSIGALHEMMFNYDGTPPNSPKMAQYWALAEELGVPVGVHSWSGPPKGESIRANQHCCPNYNGEMGNPMKMRAVLNRHTKLKVWLQHVGSDGEERPELWEETLKLLSDFPNVYVDLSITNSVLPIELYEVALNRLIEAGFGDRIMLGSDNISLHLILTRLQSLKSISAQQRRAILYGNAARFLELD